MTSDNTLEFPNSEEACPVPGTSPSLASESEIVALLSKAHTVAVVGASPTFDRTSHQIVLWLMDNTPYQVFLVNPQAGAEEIRGHGFYPSLESLPVVPDIVNVFRRREHARLIATEAVSVGAIALWLQLGIVSDEAMATATEGDLFAVQDRCIKVEYERLRSRIEHPETEASLRDR